MPIPDSWVDRIWSTMRATYGSAFDRQWECPSGVQPTQHVAAMRAHWARELAGLAAHPERIAHGLANLPERVPNLIEFRRACSAMPEYIAPALPAPPVDRARVAAELARLRHVLSSRPPAGNPAREIARNLLARSAAGERLSIVQRDALRGALSVMSRYVEETP